MKYCYLNGKIVPLNKAGIHPTDIGFLRGYGVFEFLRTYNKKTFLFKEHINRLKNSARLLHIELPMSEQKLKKIINKLLLKNKFKESTIRIVLTGGKTINGMDFDSSTLCILIEKFRNLPVSVYKKGVKLITLGSKREISEAKTLNYILAVRLYHNRLKKEKAFEILYTNNGCILECSTSNFFIFSTKGGSASGGKDITLITSKDDVLIGTTRNLVIKLARGHFKVKERKLLVSELKSAKEAFITATNKEIVPVVKIDNKKIGSGKVGKNTQKIMKLFRNYVSRFKK